VWTQSPRFLRVRVRSVYRGRGGGGSSEAEPLVILPGVDHGRTRDSEGGGSD
jgi:hypothetical protein